MSNNKQAWTGQLDLSVFNNGKKSVARDVFFEKALKSGFLETTFF